MTQLATSILDNSIMLSFRDFCRDFNGLGLIALYRAWHSGQLQPEQTRSK